MYYWLEDISHPSYIDYRSENVSPEIPSFLPALNEYTRAIDVAVNNKDHPWSSRLLSERKSVCSSGEKCLSLSFPCLDMEVNISWMRLQRCIYCHFSHLAWMCLQEMFVWSWIYTKWNIYTVYGIFYMYKTIHLCVCTRA